MKRGRDRSKEECKRQWGGMGMYKDELDKMNWMKSKEGAKGLYIQNPLVKRLI